MLWRLFHSGRHIERYIHDDAWALVTGASDGIGKALVDELLGRGFNVLIHGRNAAKLERVKEEMLAKHPARQVALVVCDASQVSYGMIEDVVRQVGDRNLTCLVNNLGATERRILPFAKQQWADVEDTTNIGIRFVAQLTRALLPKLVAHQPSVLLNLGSSSQLVHAPFVPVYAATKGFLLTLSQCIDLEMRADGLDVEVLYLDVGEVNTTAHDVGESFIVVSSPSMGKAIVDAVGCGGVFVTPHWHHECVNSVLACLPRRLQDYFVTQSMMPRRLDIVDKKTQ
ncbi:NAD(P)-binding protein [Exidia glandulosa HHB12029]|uniref:NAD(P)-binding protein n=1 Tax=Exidia glandulosa HHB12029 TaxID=1314781 RepID=A0A165EDU2_EXIGL|nr:NAD(P)-binding protein [Exidia glandulosa HHB12029]